MTLMFSAYKIPDGGTHQLESILDKEIVYLNDFQWDDKWVKWVYLKTFLEGEPLQKRTAHIEAEKLPSALDD